MTPLIDAAPLLTGLQIKLEYLNPSLSIKHRSLPATLFDRVRQGLIGQDTTLVIMTAGSAGISVAWAASQIGCQAVLLLPESTVESVAQYARWLGAEIRRGAPGQLATWLAEYRECPNHHVVEQLTDETLIGHYRAVGEELLVQNPHIAAITVAAGSAASVMGIAQAARVRKIPVYAVEPAEAAVLSGRPWQPHHIPGLAPPVPTRLFQANKVAGVIPVPSSEAWDTARETLQHTGEPVGPSSGAAIAAARRLAPGPADGNIIAICSSHMALSL